MEEEKDRDSSSRRFDNLVGRLFRPSMISQATSTEGDQVDETVIDQSAIAPAVAQQSADQYKYTFGKNTGSVLNSPPMTSSTQDSARTVTPKEKGKKRASNEYDDRERRSGSLSPWPAKGEEDALLMYSTPLTPRMQDKDKRFISKKDGSENIKAGLGITEYGSAMSREGDSLARRRSSSLGDVFGTMPSEDQSGYRRMERALEAQPQEQKRASVEGPASPFDMAGPREAPPDAAPTEKTVNVGIPRRSSSRGRSRRNPTISLEAATEETRKGNVTFRNRALSAPSTSKDAVLFPSDESRRISEEARSRRAIQQLHRLLGLPQDMGEGDTGPATRSRPLSLPILVVPSNSATVKRASVGAVSNGVTPSVFMPFDPAQSTALSFRNAAGDGPNRVSSDGYQGISTSTRPSLNLLIQSRAQAHYHLSALSAMRPRLPAATFSDLSAIRYKSWLPSLHHSFLCLIAYFHVLITLFLDYNTLYSIVEVAVFPDSSGSSAAWWIAVSIYSTSLLLWFFGVVVIWELIIQYWRRWANPRPFALPIYLSSSAFTLTSVRSFSLYSLLFKARFSAKRLDFFIETFWFYSQNWPTVLTLLPRGIILTVFLVLYNPYDNSSRVPIDQQSRDTVYFDPSTGLLTSFSFSLLLVNAAWIAWRTILLLASYIGLLFTLGPSALFERERTTYEMSDNDSILPPLTRNQASRRMTTQRNNYSSPFANQPLLGATVDDRYSSLEAQDRTREERDGAALPGTKQGRHDDGIKQEVLALNSIQLPRWAWRARAEERIKVLLIESLSSNMDSREPGASYTSPWAPYREADSQTPDAALATHREMEQVGTSRASFPAGTSRSYDVYPSLQAPFASGAQSAAVPGAMTVSAVEEGPTAAVASSSSGTSTPSQVAVAQRRGEKRGRLSASSEISTYADASTRASLDSRHSGPMDSSSRTIGGPRLSVLVGSPIRIVDEAEYPSTDSGERTPRNDETVGQTSVSPLRAVSTSESAAPVSTKKGRASSSLSSLADSLRFMRSNRSVDNMESSSSDPSVSKERSSSSGKSEGAWLSYLIKSRSRGAPDGATAASLAEEEEAEPEEPEVVEKEELTNEEEEAERASQHTHETHSTEDSEERRLWSQFPEQTRRYPPGMIALQLELEGERRRSEEEAGSRCMPASSQLHNESSEDSPRSEGLRPIKEESWTSSLENASNDSQSSS